MAGPPVTAAMVQILSSSSLRATGLVSFLAPLQRFCTLDTTSSWKLSHFCEGMKSKSQKDGCTNQTKPNQPLSASPEGIIE